MVVSYKKLNAVTKLDKYPMPRIDELLSSLKGSTFFAKIDLFSGYFQIPMCECCKEKTAFYTSEGLFQYKYVSFGMCNSPSEFNQIMRKVLSNLLGTACLCYIDDILVYGTHLKTF